MEQKLKERLIGTAVITALAAIFLPMLIDEGGQQLVRQEATLDVPPLPEKFKTKPEILREAGVDERRLFPSSTGKPTINSSAVNSGVVNAESSGSGTATAQDLAPVIKKPVLKKNPPGMQQQLETLLPTTKPQNKQATVNQTDSAQNTKVVQKTKPQVEVNSASRDKSPVVRKPVPVVAKVKDTIPGSVVSDQVDKSKPVSHQEKSKKVLSSDLTGLWIVQAGVFKEKSNAQALRKKLADSGFSAYLETVNTELGELIRVRAGRVPDESAARQMVLTLNKRFDLKSITFPETRWNSKRAGQ